MGYVQETVETLKLKQETPHIQQSRPRRLSDLPFHKNILLLQGPVGSFFYHFAKHLNARGSIVNKVNFNGGDDYFFPKGKFNVIQYRFKLDYWPSFASKLLVNLNIDAVFLFGDCRPIHKPIISICKALNIDVWVFEEGYYRPHFFTLEHFGVNHFSPMANIDLRQIDVRLANDKDITLSNTINQNAFWHMAWAAIQYWLFSLLNKTHYPDYDHHRALDWRLGKAWIKSFFRYWIYQVSEYKKKKAIFQNASKKMPHQYFLLALQLHDDAQIHTHSDFNDLEQMLEMVITSFATRALESSNEYLIIKHHPMGRGSSNYKKYIYYLTTTLGIADRVIYIHDIRLPSILPLIKGFVTVNSTLGLQALYHHIPVITLGRSFFNKHGVTFQGSLEEFWKSPGAVDTKNVALLGKYIICNSQVEGSLYIPPPLFEQYSHN
ncbi:capsular biosynthesis protein [Polynucleobacter sp. JS-Fieb-80-E5]|uniref:capsular biosynthesis protein n=1 Tax=Polynucleobacter sp. JS-Fieb-80-E5 TaxID=2081050 RepID=UPI001C0DD761|nr:capsular biosynthesis protein [Polynucleobacter sp. JS-Fieb-80-E5]MBU3618783.1 capsular biosynthesis protein [Polynucleobacter sp. JS-Fieb-80-E5]